MKSIAKDDTFEMTDGNYMAVIKDPADAPVVGDVVLVAGVRHQVSERVTLMKSFLDPGKLTVILTPVGE